MLKRMMVIAAVLSIVVWMPMPTTSSIAAKAYAEGVHLEMTVRNVGTALNITATKNVDGRWKQATVQFVSFVGYETDLYGTVLLGEDPDGLEVSRDLGWGGLEGQITVTSRWMKDAHVVEFHLALPALESAYTQDPATGYFKRNASIEGYILRDGQMWMDFSGPTAPNVVESAYNFSDQWPGY
ncbi:MAG: hypothetical protein KF716_12755 [Anaerolineae bacterium]|nr:hypothetical protein [Anaerolineae bacterium]